MSGIQATKIASYVVMPGIIPRLKGFFTSGFGYIAFLIAQIYGMVRLLPANHEYLNPHNIGKFSIRNVIAQAANNIVLKKENIDQIAIFSIILIGLALLVIQFAMILLALLFDPAMAFPSSPYTGGSVGARSIFQTADPEHDIAFMLLDQVFGVGPIGGNQFFNSCIAQGTDCAGSLGAGTTPAFTDTVQWPFHMALHELFQYYNTGILVVGAFIFLYFIVIVIGETAATGSPFGQRFQNAWVPIRLVVAIGLLIPLHYGFNSGQYITLFAAKIGSSFATNGWITYNNAIAGHNLGAGGAGGTLFEADRANPTGETESLIGHPKTPDFTPIVEMMSLVHTCAMAQWFADDNTNAGDPTAPDPGFEIVRPYFIKKVETWMTNTDTHELVEDGAGTTYDDALDFFHNSDIVIRFGHLVDDKVVPHCGDIRIKVSQVTPPGGVDMGPTEVQRLYFDTVKSGWYNPDDLEMKEFAFRMASLIMNKGDIGHCNSAGDARAPGVATDGSATGIEDADDPACGNPPQVAWRQRQIIRMQSAMDGLLNTAWDTYSQDTTEIAMTEEILDRGWAGAGIWYNTISRLNGAYLESVRDVPKFDKYPRMMEIVREARTAQESAPGVKDIFCPIHADGTDIRGKGINSSQRLVALVLCKTYLYWNVETKNPTKSDDILSDSLFEDTMNLIFGTEALGAMSSENIKTHPLAQLAMLGKGLVDASIRNIAVSSTGSALGGILGAIDQVSPQLIQAASSFVLSTAFVGLTAGLVLYYIVPFLPFIYFYFAVASWVKSIFEAMVGVPLWALAHLRLDGEGLPGNSAANGYFLIFEIFLRPILTVFGLIAATLIFTAQVRVLSFLWSIVTENLTGFDKGDPIVGTVGADPRLAFKRSIIDEFFFSIVYAIIVYMMAIAAFKLIDKIPDNLLRWMGSSVSSFGDINQDSVDGLTRYAAIGGATAGQNLAQGVQTLSSQSGTAAGSLFARLRGGT